MQAARRKSSIPFALSVLTLDSYQPSDLSVNVLIELQIILKQTALLIGSSHIIKLFVNFGFTNGTILGIKSFKCHQIK